MPWPDPPDTNPPAPRSQYRMPLPAAAVMQSAGFNLPWFDRLRLGLSSIFNGMSNEALPTQVQGVPTGGNERMRELVEILRLYVSKPNFGQNPDDATEFIGMLRARSPREVDAAKGLYGVMQNMKKKNVLGDLPELPPEPAKGLGGVMQENEARTRLTDFLSMWGR